MKPIFILIVGLLLSLHENLPAQKQSMSVKKIWDNQAYCAFTSILKYKGKYYCSFREGESHIFDKNGNAAGKVRILVSKNGDDWSSVALIGKEGYDLRDPKLSVTPDGKLMVIIGGSIYRQKKLVERIPQVCFSSDGTHYTDPIAVRLDPKVKSGNDWLWRITWDHDTGYGVNYAASGSKAVATLVKTKNGIDYEWVADFQLPDFPNETTLRILDDGEMIAMVRKEQGDRKGFWGRSYPPYDKWSWKNLDMILGGPDFIPVDSQRIIAGTRSHYIPSFPKTVLLTGNREGRFQEALVLPSGGDTSYPGFLLEKDQLWVCYYSQHETPNAAIYLAKIPLSVFFPAQ